MSIRTYVAIFYGMMALSVTVFADDLMGPKCGDDPQMMSVTEEAAEFEYDLGASWEDDDLPAYLTDGEADDAKAREDVATLAAGAAL